MLGYYTAFRYRKQGKIGGIYGHKQSGSNITTRGDYIITQYGASVCELVLGLIGCVDKNSSYYEQGTSSTDPSKNWTWVNDASDGAHAYARSNVYFTIDYKGYPDPIIRQTGSTYYIDYGAVDMDYRNDHQFVNPNCTELPCPAGTTNQGTYYNHTAASAGTSVNADQNTFPDGIAPDSICPRGWKLPDYKGSKSYINLMNYAYGEIRNGSGIGSNMDVIALYPPLSFLRTGFYYAIDTRMVNLGLTGVYWEVRIASDIRASFMQLDIYTSIALNTQNNSYRGYGNSVRCVSRG